MKPLELLPHRNHKICKMCKEEKPFVLFLKQKRRYRKNNGENVEYCYRDNWCCSCRSKKAAEYYKKRKEKLAYERSVSG